MKSIAKIALCALLVLGAPSLALAQDTLEQAKQMGLVGERPDGLVGAVSATLSADVKAMVESINAQRKQRYGDIAQKNGISVTQVQAVAGKELLDRTPAGQYVMNAAGKWVKK